MSSKNSSVSDYIDAMTISHMLDLSGSSAHVLEVSQAAAAVAQLPPPYQNTSDLVYSYYHQNPVLGAGFDPSFLPPSATSSAISLLGDAFSSISSSHLDPSHLAFPPTSDSDLRHLQGYDA
ncbi:hypothetical protein Ciccas_002737, partial [Cichlidogyrus casuarinus]